MLKCCVLCLLLASCHSSRMVQTELYFGQSKPRGGIVTAAEWNDFSTNYIGKVFREGSSVVQLTGNWYDPERRTLITEPTYKVIYFYKKSASLSTRIDSLRYWYKTLFQQQSVLRVDQKVKAFF